MRILRLVPAALALLLSACGDDGPSSPAACQLACERASACSPGYDSRSCRASCTGYPATSPVPPPALSPRYLDAVRRCVGAVSCSSADVYAASDACAYDAALRLEPSKPARDLCKRADSADRYCGSTTIDPYDCLSAVKVYDDAVLRRATRCYDGPCASQGACVSDVFGGFVYYPL